jgi:hypothetical protein
MGQRLALRLQLSISKSLTSAIASEFHDQGIGRAIALFVAALAGLVIGAENSAAIRTAHVQVRRSG